VRHETDGKAGLTGSLDGAGRRVEADGVLILSGGAKEGRLVGLPVGKESNS